MAKFRSEIHLDTLREVNAFVAKMSSVNEPVFLIDGANLRVSAKSVIGALYTLEWSKLFVESDIDLGEMISEFRVDA